MRSVLLFPLGVALFGRFAWVILSPLAAIWRGNASRVPDLYRLQPQARTYLPFSLWAGSLFVGMCLMAVGATADVLGIWQPLQLLAIVGLGGVYAAGPLLLVNVFAWAFNRPKFLIVPAYRNHPGWMRTTVRRMRARVEQFGARRSRSRQ
jgi:hypothetical protein